MGQTPAQIRAQMEKLEAKLQSAELKEREKIESKILKAATRSGLVKTQMTIEELTEHFAKIIEAEQGKSDQFCSELGLKRSGASSSIDDADEYERTTRLDKQAEKTNTNSGPSL